jgi:thioredoxin reductase (NADPH)
LNDAGYIITDERFRTSIEGVFAAGEIQDQIWRQVATSAGQGVSAAMSAIHWLETNEASLQKLDDEVSDKPLAQAGD